MEQTIEQRVMAALLRKVEELIDVQWPNEDVRFEHGYANLKTPNTNEVCFSTSEIIDIAEYLENCDVYEFRHYEMERIKKLAEDAKKHEYEISHGEVEVDGIKIQTRKESMESCNILSVEAGTTGHMGGDTGHGGRTYLRISDDASTDMRCIVKTDDGKTHKFDGAADVTQIEIMLGGDTELDTFIEALEFAAKTLRSQK